MSPDTPRRWHRRSALAVLHLFVKPSAAARRRRGGRGGEAGGGDGDQVVPWPLPPPQGRRRVHGAQRGRGAPRRFQTDVQAAGPSWSTPTCRSPSSRYAQGLPPERNQARLHPVPPPEGKQAWCFYPMSKRRNVGANWFTLPHDEAQGPDVRARRLGPEVRRPGRPGRHRLHRPRRLQSGRHPLRGGARRPSRRSSTRCDSTRRRPSTASSRRAYTGLHHDVEDPGAVLAPPRA